MADATYPPPPPPPPPSLPPPVREPAHDVAMTGVRQTLSYLIVQRWFWALVLAGGVAKETGAADLIRQLADRCC